MPASVSLVSSTLWAALRQALLCLLLTVTTAETASAQLCGTTNAQSCIVIHPTPGCNSPQCCENVCSNDPGCCGQGGWDAACVALANLLCIGYPGATASGSCFSAHNNPNCDSADCCTAVCALDPTCCQISWDLTCATYAGFACQGTPGTCGSPSAGSCFASHPTGACSDAVCCNAVCTIDPSCCSSAWDLICVSLANQTCVGTCQPVAEPGAVPEVEECGARTNDPCYLATGGTPQVLTAGIQVTGTLGIASGSSAAADVDVYTVSVVDTDGDGLAKIRLQFASSPRAWAALLPNQPCTPMSAKILQVSSELCVSATSAEVCVPPGTYRVVVGAGTFPQFGGVQIGCSIGNKYTVKVSFNQGCSNACLPTAGTCFAPKSTRGCNSSQCCAAVCAVDSVCCDEQWDATCVLLAGDSCLSGPPANDTCAGALTAVMGTQTVNTLRSSLELGQEPTACLNATFARDIWYRWTSDRNGSVSVATCNPWFDTLLAVYAGNCKAPVLVGCNDNAANCGGIGSRVTFAATCGATYYFRIGPRNGSGGEITMTLSSAAPTCTNCPADFNGDRQVGAQDLALLLGAWGTAGGDVTGNGTTDAQDLAALLGAWGACP